MNLLNIFKRKNNNVRAQLISMNSVQKSASVSAYQCDLVRSCVDAIATNIAKLHGVHVTDNTRVGIDDRITRLFEDRPNPMMTPFDFMYKVSSQWLLNNNAWIYIDRDERGNVQALYPVDVSSLELVRTDAGRVYARLVTRDGARYCLPYDDLIHLRRHFSDSVAVGDDTRPLNSAVAMYQSADDGIRAGIENCAHLKGIVRMQTISQDEKKEADKFRQDFLTASNSGGVAVIDSGAEFTPISQTPYPLDRDLIAEIKKKVFSWYHVPESIITGSFSEQEYQAFYEQVVEPFGLLFSQEATSKIFTDRERAFGNRIIFQSEIMAFMSNATKVSFIRELMPLGLLSRNEARMIMNYSPIEDGDVYVQTLNVVDADSVTDYQKGKAGIHEGNQDSQNSGG